MDLYSKEGAIQICNAIKEYWLSQGYEVKPFIESQGFTMDLKTTLFVVRSDMVNGLPRKKKGRARC